MDITELPAIATREFMGGTVESFREDGGSACVRFLPPEGMTNPHGTVQGGFVAAMVDDVVSLATFFAGGGRPDFVTTNINVWYLRPVPVGRPLLVSCALVRAGRRQAVFDAFVRAEGDDRLLVKAVQTQQFVHSE